MLRLLRITIAGLVLGLAGNAFVGSAAFAGAATRARAEGAARSRTQATPRPRNQLVVASKVFGRRYCELFLVKKRAAGFSAAVFNTYGLNDCPPAKWKAIDTAAVANATHSLAAVRNGPRFWAMDRIEKHRQGREVIKNLGGLRMIQEAVLSLASLKATPYAPHRVNRTTVFVYNAGRTIYELHGVDGSRWIMQSWSDGVDPRLGLRDLPTLGRRLRLPVGWSYRTRRLSRGLRVVTVHTDAEVLQDDFGNSYSRVTSGSGRSPVRPTHAR